MPTTAGRNGARWQFSLRAMFLLTLSAATLAAIARVAAQLDVLVLGIAAAVWSTRGAVRSWRTTSRLSVRSLAALAVSWCAFYTVSVGPAIVVARFFVWTQTPLEIVYAPLIWTHNHTPLADPLEWYAEFWRGLS